MGAWTSAPVESKSPPVESKPAESRADAVACTPALAVSDDAASVWTTISDGDSSIPDKKDGGDPVDLSDDSSDDNNVPSAAYTAPVYDHTDFVTLKDLLREPNSRSKYAGRTVRCKNYSSHIRENQVLLYSYQPAEDLSSDTRIVFRTAFDDSSVRKNANKYKYSVESFESNLNRKNAWEEALELLTTNAVRAVRPAYHNIQNYYAREIHFELPVIREEIIHEERPDTKSDKGDFNWLGKIYNCSKLYQIRETGCPKRPEFREFGSYQYADIPIGTVQKKASIRVSARTESGSYHICGLNPDDYWGTRGELLSQFAEDYQGTLRHVEFDFGCDTDISHISTMGMPYITDKFPGKTKKTRMPRGAYIQYLREQRNHYVKKYRVYARADHSSQWHIVGVYAGNTDRLTEVTVTLESPVIARFIRIIPLEYGDTPSMRIRFFGRGELNVESIDNKPETVTYQLTIPTGTPGVLNYSNPFHDSWYHPKNESHKTLRGKSRIVSSKMVKYIRNRKIFDDESVYDW